MLPLALPHYRSQHRQLRSFALLHQKFYDLVDRLAGDLSATNRTVRNADPRIHQTQIIVNFRYRSYCGTRVFIRGFLIDRDRR